MRVRSTRLLSSLTIKPPTGLWGDVIVKVCEKRNFVKNLAQIYSILRIPKKSKTTKRLLNVFVTVLSMHVIHRNAVFLIKIFLFPLSSAHWSMRITSPSQKKNHNSPYTIPPALFSKISASTCFLSHHLLPSCKPMLVPAKPNSINKSLALNASVWKTCCKRGI